MNHDSAINAEGPAMGKEMFHEDHIMATRKLAMGRDMLNEDNVGLSQDILDMESFAGLNQSIAVFAAPGKKSTNAGPRSPQITSWRME